MTAHDSEATGRAIRGAFVRPQSGFTCGGGSYPMSRIPFAAAALLMCSICLAGPAQRPTAYDEMIAREAGNHGVPEAFVHRMVMRESRYRPRLVHNHCFGLMQIKYATARDMGYRGDARGLLDPQTNLTYAVPYLANAYRLADRNEDRAAALFRSGYYAVAKQKKMQGLLPTASSPALIPEPAPPPVRIPSR
jgi:soluble lytic murein transglycosylase-like protein